MPGYMWICAHCTDCHHLYDIYRWYVYIYIYRPLHIICAWNNLRAFEWRSWWQYCPLWFLSDWWHIYIYIYIYLPCRLYAKRGRVCVWGFLVVSSLHIHTKPYCWEYNTLAAHECQRNDRMGLYTPKSSYPYIPISLPLPLIYPHGHTNTAFYLPTCLMCYACVHCGWIGGIWVFVLVSILNFLVFKTHTRALMNPHRTYIQLRMYSCT